MHHAGSAAGADACAVHVPRDVCGATDAQASILAVMIG